MRRPVGFLILFVLLLSPYALPRVKPAPLPTAPTAIYDDLVKIVTPPEWSVKRSWDLSSADTLDRDMPFYRPDLPAVAYIGGETKQTLIPENLNANDAPDDLGILMSHWPAEASRFFVALGGFSTSQPKPGMIVFGESYAPGTERYLGQMKLGAAQVKLAEWLTTGALDDQAAKGLRLPSSFKGRKLQCILGQGRFEVAASGYRVVACRFTTSEHGVEWLTALLANVEPLAPSEQEDGRKAARVRMLVTDAADRVYLGKFADAAAKLAEALKLSPDDENALTLEAGLLLQSNNVNEAEKLLNNAVAINPNHEYSRYFLGQVLCKKGEKVEASNQFKLLESMTIYHPALGCK